MSQTEKDRNPDQQGDTDARPDLAEHERPETGLISDEELPEDVRPSDDNPLAKDPEEGEELSRGPAMPGQDEGAPGMGNPGAPA